MISASWISKKLGCNVEVTITTNYTAEIEATRAGKLEMGEFGPLGYVLAHKVAAAEAVAAFGNKDGQPETYTAGMVTWPGSGITDIRGVVGHTFAYSDPASTSGHLFPAYALTGVGIKPDTGVKAIYAGSHSASFEALRNHKVEAGELNSQETASATLAGSYKPGRL
ncbi:MAG: phosphate/phosphite/phosphonate ABC transporter substrate-binding protein, partial [Acetobacteraceae bacterium]|nr:phosphate/phosphite/phosphonate ABC transporter substrate-binding protein [Acetobacteraceae bacterium]